MFSLLPAQLAEAIKGNTSLKLLDIGGNNIGPEGIKVLLEALRGNETLTTLELGYNPIGEEGAKHLADVLKYDLKVSLSKPSCESIAKWLMLLLLCIQRLCCTSSISSRADAPTGGRAFACSPVQWDMRARGVSYWVQFHESAVINLIHFNEYTPWE